jgi:hypothetical protein
MSCYAYDLLGYMLWLHSISASVEKEQDAAYRFFFCPYVACFGVPLQSSFQFFSMDVMGFCLLIEQFARWLHMF